MTDPATQKLRLTLAELETELRAVDKLDGQTRAMLQLAMDEIQAALHAKTSQGTSAPHTLAERLRLTAADFEGSHPTLASLLHRMVDALAQLGI
jgi:hypothetical protein